MRLVDGVRLAHGCGSREIVLATARQIRIQLTHTFEDTDSSAKVVDPSGGLEGSGDDRGGGDEIVGEGVVEVALISDQPKSYDFPFAVRLRVWAKHQAKGKPAAAPWGAYLPEARKCPELHQTPSRICTRAQFSHWSS